MTILDTPGFVALVTTLGGMLTTYGAIFLNGRINKDNQREVDRLNDEIKRLKK